jgi:D-alanine-D-alanine ligase-like ATP-grasp enzyme
MVARTAVIQIVSTSKGIVLDVQTTNVATDGRTHQCHAVTKLAADEAMRLQIALQDAIDAAWGTDDPTTERSDPRQTALWSQSTSIEPLRRRAA